MRVENVSQVYEVTDTVQHLDDELVLILYYSDAEMDNVQQSMMKSVSQPPTPGYFDIFSQTVKNFWSKFYMPITHSYLRCTGLQIFI